MVQPVLRVQWPSVSVNIQDVFIILLFLSLLYLQIRPSGLSTSYYTLYLVQSALNPETIFIQNLLSFHSDEFWFFFIQTNKMFLSFCSYFFNVLLHQTAEDISHRQIREMLNIVCTSENNTIWIMAMLIYKAFVVVFGAFLSWSTRYNSIWAPYFLFCDVYPSPWCTTCVLK